MSLKQPLPPFSRNRKLRGSGAEGTVACGLRQIEPGPICCWASSSGRVIREMLGTLRGFPRGLGACAAE